MTMIVPDSEHRGLVARLPRSLRGLALLARLDRPIGWWLLFWPGAWGVALTGGVVARWDLILWILAGSIAMRGAGCVYNDIVDRDLDGQVARTAARPIPSGMVSVQLLGAPRRCAPVCRCGCGWRAGRLTICVQRPVRRASPRRLSSSASSSVAPWQLPKRLLRNWVRRRGSEAPRMHQAPGAEPAHPRDSARRSADS